LKDTNTAKENREYLTRKKTIERPQKQQLFQLSTNQIKDEHLVLSNHGVRRPTISSN